jgi:hypothetical protein
MGRVARYKKAKQFQYQIKKEPDLLGPEGKNVPPKPAGGDPAKQLPASLRRMMAAQEKMKEIEGTRYTPLPINSSSPSQHLLENLRFSPVMRIKMEFKFN